MSSAIKVSVVIPVLNSHEIVRRQALHFRRIGIPDDVQIIFVDDGSDPPIEPSHPIHVVYTDDRRPWTWALARNYGARVARGDYLLMTDLDYIISRDLLDYVRAFNGDKMRFKREFGVLLADGTFSQDWDVLKAYGLPERRLRDRGTKMPPHPNNFAMRRDLYWELGGYREDLVERPYPQGEDRWFKREWTKALEAGKVKDHEHRPTIYMFPNGQFCGDVDYNPHGLFHTLTRKTDANPWHKRIEAGIAR